MQSSKKNVRLPPIEKNKKIKGGARSNRAELLSPQVSRKVAFMDSQHSSDILTSWQQYRSEVVAHQRLTHSEEQKLVERAQAGDELAKHEIVQACLWYVTHVAQKYADLPHDDLLDLVGIGNLALVEHIDRALGKPNPFAYLMKIGALEIKHYVGYRSYLIPRNDDRYPAIHVQSLDAPLNEKGITRMDLLAKKEDKRELAVVETTISTELQQAIAQLTERQKYVVERAFGLDGYGPETLGDISRRLSANPAATLAGCHLQDALKRLRKALQE